MYRDDDRLEGADPKCITGLSQYEVALRRSNGLLQVPEKMSPGELEWEYWVSKLHWNYVRASVEDLEKIKEIVNRIS